MSSAGCSGGECSYLALHPLRRHLLRPRRGRPPGAQNYAQATLQVDVAAALAWRDFMVADYSDAGQEAGSRVRALSCSRHGGSPRRGRRRCGGVQPHRRNVVIGDGFTTPYATCPRLEPICRLWTSREVTGMKSMPQRLLVLGGGPVGRNGSGGATSGRTMLSSSRARRTCSPREPVPLGDCLGEVLAARRYGVVPWNARKSGARRDGDDFVLSAGRRPRVARRPASIATGRRPRVDGIGSENPSASTSTRTASRRRAS